MRPRVGGWKCVLSFEEKLASWRMVTGSLGTKRPGGSFEPFWNSPDASGFSISSARGTQAHLVTGS